MPEQAPPQTAELLHYYEIRMAAFSKYAELAWNRFNWLLTLQVVIIGFHVSQSSIYLDRYAEMMRVYHHSDIATIALAVAVAWAIVGWADYRSLHRFHDKCKKLENFIRTQFQEAGHLLPEVESASRPVRQSWLLFGLPSSWAILWGARLLQFWP